MLLNRKLLPILTLLAIAQSALIMPGSAQMLQGGVQEENFRLAPAEGKKDEQAAKPNPLRIARITEDDSTGKEETAQMDPNALKGLVDTNDFTPNNFEIGAERNSQEMVLAWERWHHQLTAAMWQRWHALNRTKGRAMMRITVTRDLHITAECLKRRSNQLYVDTIMEAVNSLDKNPGLTFPALSQRQVVTFDINLTAGNVPAGYTWDKRDFETVRKDD